MTAAVRRLVHTVTSLAPGRATSFAGGRLTVDAAEAAALVADPALASVRVSTAEPGDPVRLVKVLDGAEPRTDSRGGAFPGFLGSPRPLPAELDVHVLRGAAVVAAGHLPRAQEAVVDMSGPGASLSPFGGLRCVVVEFEPAPGADWAAVDAAVRRGTLRLAERLAAAAADAPPDAIEEAAPPGDSGPGRPRIAAVTYLQTQGLFKDVFVFGRSFAGALPALLDPAALELGAVVSGQFGHPALRNPTYVHQNHPVVAALRARHGADASFAGVVIAPEAVEDGAKRLIAAHAARLCAAIGANAAVVTKEGGGNADADVSLTMEALASLGVEGIGIFAEMAGPDGTGPPLVVPPPDGAPAVSTGNYDERVALPAVERAFGGARVDVADAAATDALTVPVALFPAALSPLGWGRLTARAAA